MEFCAIIVVSINVRCCYYFANEERNGIMANSTKTQNGSLKISNDVIIKIAELAAVEVEGIVVNDKRLPSPRIGGVSNVFSKFASPIKVIYSREAVGIELCVIVKNGYKALAVAQNVQKAVKSAIQNMAHIAVSKVDVKVIGAQTPQQSDE